MVVTGATTGVVPNPGTGAYVGRLSPLEFRRYPLPPSFEVVLGGTGLVSGGVREDSEMLDAVDGAE